jgi:hypothetical protein
MWDLGGGRSEPFWGVIAGSPPDSALHSEAAANPCEAKSNQEGVITDHSLLD